MSAKHTKGPWKVEYETDITGTENDPENGCVGVVDVAHVYLRTVAGRTEANARLISAAPELLEVLRELEQSCEYWSEYDVPLGIVDRIKSAITKATGEQP